MALHCPSCGWAAEELLDADTLDHLDEELERGLEEVAFALSRFTELNMIEYIDRFASALREDVILPEDF